MTDITKSKIFNPFFTTKEVGKGMGLGLSLSYGILTKIHGSMIVESKQGKGTEFLVRIPIDFRETV
jgi:signal transduction histidine kinase